MTPDEAKDEGKPLPAPAGPAPIPAGFRAVAVLDVGTTGIRMQIAEITAEGEARWLDTLHQPVALGKDTFTRGAIRPETIEECVNILRGYARVMREYGIERPDQMLAVATSAVREAQNRETFLNRIHTATRIPLRVIDEAEESRLTYMAYLSLTAGDPDLRGRDALVADVGGGGTEIVLVQNNFVTFADSIRMGSVRLRETLEANRAPVRRMRPLLDQQIDRIVASMRQNIPPSASPLLVAMSGDARLAASQISPDWESAHRHALEPKALEAFVDKLLAQDADKIVRKFKITFQEAENLAPALLVYLHLAQAFKVDQIIVPKITMRDGLLRDFTTRSLWAGALTDQVLHSAAQLRQKYHADGKHAECVAEICLRLFRELREEHRLERRHEVLLLVAAHLHEIGNFVSPRSHHKHSMYLIRNSDLFGLSREDTALVALVARYHRRAVPSASHVEYMAMDREDRLAVSKMAAILRVADALDRNHLQHARQVVCAREENRLVLTVPQAEDLTLERMALKEKGQLFRDIYGLAIELQEDRQPHRT